MSGRVRYELTIRKVGVGPQIGWATPKFIRYSDNQADEGTGDDAHSWGADGDRQLAWHNGHGADRSYPVAWAAGDVIGVAADLDTGALLYAQNGAWEKVFDGCDFGEMGIFPSITTDGGLYAANFGASPFRFSGPSTTGYAAVAPDARSFSRSRGRAQDDDGEGGIRDQMHM